METLKVGQRVRIKSPGECYDGFFGTVTEVLSSQAFVRVDVSMAVWMYFFNELDICH